MKIKLPSTLKVHIICTTEKEKYLKSENEMIVAYVGLGLGVLIVIGLCMAISHGTQGPMTKSQLRNLPHQGQKNVK